MKAAVLYNYGDASSLRYEDFPDPKPGAGEVLVRVISTSVNPIDYKLRGGAMKQMMPLRFPAILGRDVAGEVAGVGEGVTRFRPGDLVMGLVNASYAEFLTAKEDSLTSIPQGLDPKQAGVLPLILQTGGQLIEDGVKPRAGETVLVTGAAGSVGRTAVFVARQSGANVIAGVRARQKAQSANLGADAVIALDSDDDLSRIPELDAIADTIDGKTIGQLIPKLKREGRLASVLGKPEGADRIDVRQVWAEPRPEQLHRLASDVRDRKLSIPIARTMRLSEIAEAHRLAESGAEGKIAILP